LLVNPQAAHKFKRKNHAQLKQGNDFVMFFGVQQLFLLFGNIQHATFMQDRPSASIAPNPTTSEPCDSTIMKTTHQRET
jgi:hypothetical protein